MKPIKPANSNFVYAAPQGQTDVADLHCHVYEDDDVRIITSSWMPSAEELALLNSGQPVQLHVYGTGHPIVSLTVARNAAG